MTIEEQLKNLVIERGGSVNKFAGKCGLPYSTIASVFNRGIVNSNISTIIAICRELHISADELCNGRITPLQYLDSNAEYLNISELTEENQAKIKDYYEMLLKIQKGD